MSAGELRGRLTTAEAAREFALAGDARLTVVSLRTGTRFTFKVQASERAEAQGRCLHFVSVLSGDDNETSYTFIGTVFREGWERAGGDMVRPLGRFRHGGRSRVSAGAPSVTAFRYLWWALDRGRLPPDLEVWHEGRCGACGRRLTVPESVARGLGPECAARARESRQRRMVP